MLQGKQNSICWHKRSAAKIIKEEASALGLPYIDKRWLGGTLTNWKTIRGSVRRLLDIEEMITSGRINNSAKDLQKENEISEDELKRIEAEVQKTTDHFIGLVEEELKNKEADLAEI